MVNWPKITVVTPNYNQGKYLEKCILSIIDQNYPNLEYFIYDGKSTDNSLEIIKRYKDKISYWTSKPDKGQTDAINKGLEKATGQIFNWLNADDYLEPNALQKVVAAYQMNPDAAAWIGSCRIVDTMGKVEKVIMPNGLEREHIGHNWNGMVFYQPSCFMSREKICKAGGLNISLSYCMDFELYLRLIEKQHFSIGTGIWANALKHSDAKTQKTLNQCYLEVIDVQKKYGFHEGAKNRYERRFAKGRLEYILPAGLKERLKILNNGNHKIRLSEIPTSFYWRKNICFLGNLDSPLEFESFIHFLKNIFPLILKRNPTIEVHIYNDIKRDIINRLGQKNLKIFNNINEFKKAAYQSKLCVIPLCFEKGLIDDFKIAASMGVPIVTTAHGVSGYKVMDGLECFIANEDDEFAEKCNQLISDPSTWGNFSARLLLMMFDGNELSHSCSNSNNRKAFKGSSYENRRHITIVQGGFPALSGTFILDQMTGLIDRGYEIENWPTYNPNENGIHPDIFKYCLLNRTRYLKLPNDNLRSKPEIWTRQFLELNNLESLNYSDIFHVHYGSNFNLLEPLFRYFPNKFIVVSFHGHDASRYFKKNGDTCYKYLFERANFITTPSFTMKNELIKRGCKPEKIQVHRYGVDLKKFIPGSKNDNISHIRLLTVARLVEKKGLEYSLKALATLDNIEKIKYRIIGEGPLKEYLQNVAKNLGIENCVKFIGGKTKNEVIKEMSIADIFLLNSITAKDGDMEGVPVSLIEAQAMGLPVVSSYHAGIPELIIDGETGFLAEEKNISQIAAGLDKLIASTKLRNTFSDNAKRRTKAEFDIERLNDKLKSYFEIGIRNSKYPSPQFSNKQAEYSCSIRCKGDQEKLARRPIDKEDDRATKKDFSHKLIKSIAEIKACFQNLNWGQRLLAYERSFEYAEVLDGREPSEISIIIICEKYSNDLRRNLETINQQRHHNFQLILVNNGSKDNKLGDLKSYIDIYIKLNTNTGAYFSRNIGTLFANAPILLFLDDDGIPETNLIKAHLDAFKKYNVVAVRGVCLPKTENHLNNFANHYYLGAKPFPIFADIEGNTSYLAKTFFEAGGWDDKIIFGGGGFDLARRLLDVEPDYRKQIYSPEPIIFHDYADDIKHLKSKQIKQKNSRERLKNKHNDYDAFIASWSEFNGRDDLIIKKNPSECSTADSLQVLISILIPSYNREKYIARAIDSALVQCKNNIEVVVVDDGSTDNTSIILDGFESDRLRYIYKDHTGAPDTRNKAIEEARGQYILWLDSDDVLMPDTIENYLKAISDYPDVDVFYGDLEVTDESGNLQKELKYSDYYNQKESVVSSLITSCPIPNGGTLIKKSVFQKYGGYNLSFKRAHDYEFWARVAHQIRFKHIGTFVYKWRWHDGNMSSGTVQIDSSYDIQIIKNILRTHSLPSLFPHLNWKDEAKSSEIAYFTIGQVFQKFKGYYEAIENYNKCLEINKRENYYCLLGITYFQANDIQKSIHAFNEALRISPHNKKTKEIVENLNNIVFSNNLTQQNI